MKKIITIIISGLIIIPGFFACNSSSDTGNSSEVSKDSASYFDTTAGVSLKKEREMQMNLDIEDARMALDSINLIPSILLFSTLQKPCHFLLTKGSS